jgi:phosphinothricin acetyltransferase
LAARAAGTTGSGAVARPDIAEARVRPYEAADAEPARAIYNAAVRDSTASWDWDPLDQAAWAAWAGRHAGPGRALLVADWAGVVVGFAGYGPFRAKAGYAGTVEDSVYLRADARGQGVGGRLLEALIARAQADGLHIMAAALSSDNAASQALHARHGFVIAGVLPEVGQKFGRWLDLTVMVRRLDALPPVAPPSAR